MQRHPIASEPEPLYELLSCNFQTSNAARKYYTSAMQSRVQILHARVHACMHQASRSWHVEEAAQTFIVLSRYGQRHLDGHYSTKQGQLHINPGRGA